MTQREQYKQAEHGNTIPRAITEITIKRNPYNDTVYVAMKTPLWESTFHVSEEHLYTRIHEITAEMERVK